MNVQYFTTKTLYPDPYRPGQYEQRYRTVPMCCILNYKGMVICIDPKTYVATETTSGCTIKTDVPIDYKEQSMRTRKRILTEYLDTKKDLWRHLNASRFGYIEPYLIYPVL